MATEASIVSTICANLKRRGIFHWKTTGSVFGKSGLPDLMVVIEGRLIALEVKRPGKAATRLQQHRMEQLRKAGAVAEVVTGWPEVAALIVSSPPGRSEPGKCQSLPADGSVPFSDFIGPIIR